MSYCSRASTLNADVCSTSVLPVAPPTAFADTSKLTCELVGSGASSTHVYVSASFAAQFSQLAYTCRATHVPNSDTDTLSTWQVKLHYSRTNLNLWFVVQWQCTRTCVMVFRDAYWRTAKRTVQQKNSPLTQGWSPCQGKYRSCRCSLSTDRVDPSPPMRSE